MKKKSATLHSFSKAAGLRKKNRTLSTMLDRHAPIMTKTITVRPLVPWCDDEIREARRERRKAERQWRYARSLSDLAVIKGKKNYATHLINEARKRFYSNVINENSSSQRDLFSTTRKLLKQDNETLFPPFKDKLQLANEMGDFFVKKISDIHARLDEMTEALPSSNSPSSYGASADVVAMETFAQLSESDVKSSVLISAEKTRLLDPIPTRIVVDCLDALLPVLTKTTNTSLITGRFADDWKSALVSPLLKKAGADRVSKNYRPVSNLQYVSKLTERAVFDQTHNDTILNHIFAVFSLPIVRNIAQKQLC